MTRLTRYDHDGLVFDLLDEGPLDGTPVVLLHGFPERAASWRRVAPILHERGLRTYAPDQRGYSPGARPARYRDYRLSALAGDVIALIERIGQPVHLAGHDWGAAAGWAVAAWRRDLVRSWTAFSVPHLSAYTSALLGPQGPRSWYMAMFSVPGLTERLAVTPGGGFDRLLRRFGMTPDEIARCRAEVIDYGALPGGLAWYRAMPYILLDPVPAVSVPTTMVWSDGDAAISRTGPMRTARHCTGPYEYVELLGVTHWIPTQAAEPAAQAILSRIAAS